MVYTFSLNNFILSKFYHLSFVFTPLYLVDLLKNYVLFRHLFLMAIYLFRLFVYKYNSAECNTDLANQLDPPPVLFVRETLISLPSCLIRLSISFLHSQPLNYN